MIVRVVKLTFEPGKLSLFHEEFVQKQDLIRSFPGCKGMKLLEDVKQKHVLFTISEWDSEEDLNKYRNSELFKTTWGKVKQLFAAPPEAYSLITK